MAEREAGSDAVWVCASVQAASPAEFVQRLQTAADADLVEIRWDALEDPVAAVESLAEVVRSAPAPVVFTCRPAWQGGAFDGGEALRRTVLEAGLKAGARWVDVELDAPWGPDFARSHRDRTLVSHHWSSASPPDLERRLTTLLDLRPAVAKLVAPADRPSDAVPFLRAAERLRGAGIVPACFCMDEAGRASRLLSVARAGGLLYVAADSGAITAPGQWRLRTVRHELKVGRWRPGFSLFGLAGDPIGHSLSPAIFNAAFAAAGRPACYVPLPGPDPADVLVLAEAAGVAGLSVTMPFKEASASACGELTGLAARLRVANTLVRAGDRWVGHNTDGAALVGALATHLDPSGARVVMVGAGGAARAAAAALVDAGAEVVIVNRDARRGRELADELGASSDEVESVPGMRFDALVNATPVGMAGTVETPVSTAGLSGREVVVEMIYRPAETELLRQARGAGCRIVVGLEMFVRQAEAQHRLWTAEPPPAGVMRKTAVARLEADVLV